MNYKTRCTKVYLELQKILVFTPLPLSLVDCILHFVLAEVGMRLHTSKIYSLTIIYDIQFNKHNKIDYCIWYVPGEKWNKCKGECNWDSVVNHREHLQCYIDPFRFHAEDAWSLWSWYPLPQKEIECAGTIVRACMYCGASLCEACFLQSKMLMGTVGDANMLFDAGDVRPPITCFPRLGYYPAHLGCFGLLRICIYCEAIRQHGGKPNERKYVSEAKVEWANLMRRVKKNK